MKLHTKYQRPGPSSFIREEFSSFSLYHMRLCKITDPCIGAITDPQYYNFNNLGSSPLDEATYQISKGSSTSSVKHHSETHIIKSTVMKQSKELNGDLKPGHKKTTNRTTMSPTTGIGSRAPTI